MKTNPKDSTQKIGTGSNSTLQGEVGMQHLKCYKCKEKGHTAKDCLNVNKKPATWVTETEQDQEPKDDDYPWMRTVSACSEVEVLPVRGPTYKVNIFVDILKTRVLLGHGAQVSLSAESCFLRFVKSKGVHKTRNLKLDRQHVRANGTDLGVAALVKLMVSIEVTNKTLHCVGLQKATLEW